MVIVIDNYDSFAYNLVQYLGELGWETAVYRNDRVTLAQIEDLRPSHIIISPGPCTPLEAGISNDFIVQSGLFSSARIVTSSLNSSSSDHWADAWMALQRPRPRGTPALPRRTSAKRSSE